MIGDGQCTWTLGLGESLQSNWPFAQVRATIKPAFLTLAMAYLLGF